VRLQPAPIPRDVAETGAVGDDLGALTTP
jgi:hypothetical protein